MNKFWKLSINLAIAAGFIWNIVALAGSPAMAHKKRWKHKAGGVIGYVTAHSRYDPYKNFTTPVRRGRLGAQVRTPGGTWVYCEGSCSETIRAQYLDFWETQREDAGGDGDFR